MNNNDALRVVVVIGLVFAGSHRAAADGSAWPLIDQQWAATCAKFDQAFKTQTTCAIDHPSFDRKTPVSQTADRCVNVLLRMTEGKAGRACAADDKCRAIAAAKLKTISCRLDDVKSTLAAQTDSALTIRIPALPGDATSQVQTNFADYMFALAPDLFWSQQVAMNPDHTHEVCKNNAKLEYDRSSIRVEDLVNSANVDAKAYCSDFVIELQKLCSYNQAPQAEALTSIVCGQAKPGKPQSATLSGTTLRFEFAIVNGNFIASDKPNSAREVVDKAFGQ